MADAIEGAGDLALIAGLLLAIGCLYAIVFILRPIVSLLDFSVLGYRPLHGLAVAIDKYLVGGAKDAINASEKVLTQLFYGLVDSFGLLIGVPVALGLAIRDALVYLWHTAIRAFVNNVVNPVRHLATEAWASVTALERTVVRDFAAAEHFATSEAERAIRSAEAFATRDANAARAAAETFASEAVAKLRAAEDAALATATRTFDANLHSAERAFDTALGDVRGIAVGAEQDLKELYGKFGLLGAAGLIAAIPALATLVNTIATEAGLDSSECRGKVKGICGTNTSAWENLLLSIAAAGLIFDLSALVRFARELAGPVEDLVKRAA